MISRKLPVIVCLALCVHDPLRAGVTADGMTTPDDKSTTAPTLTTEEEPKNWIELGIGGVITSGDRAQFEQEHRLPGDQAYGGIQDLHFEQTIGKDGQFVVDGHALFDIHDYDLRIELSKPKVGYIRIGYDEFRSWYDGNGGFFPPHGGTWFAPPFPEMHIDRGEAWIELGLRLPDWPEITIRYSHEFRDGQKDSTIWGDTNLTGGGNVVPGLTRKIVPSFRDIDETRDIFALDATKTFGNTDVTLGMRYEHSDVDNRLQLERAAGQLPPVVPPPGAQRFITQRDENKADFFSGHAFTETRITDSLWFTAGYSYTALGSDVGGSRIFGTHYNADFGEPVPTLRPFDHGFLNLAGSSDVSEHVFNANLLWSPSNDLTLLSAFRYTHANREADTTYLATDTEPNEPPFTPANPEGGAHLIIPGQIFSNSSGDYDRFGERLELRYTGIKDWLFYAEGQWEEETGHRFERQHGPGVDEPLNLDEDTSYLGQKYTVGANWYPTARLSLSGQYYHKIASYDNDIHVAVHQRLLGQDWNTDDANVRITYRPNIPGKLGTIAFVTRYDFMRTTIDGQWALFSDEEILAEQQSGVITKHVITESVTWNPLARLYVQGDISYALDQTETPASRINLAPLTSPTVLDFRNDYWTLTASGGYILDDKTDLSFEYSFFRATDYTKNAQVGLPYGLGATENTASVAMTRQISKNVRLLVRYTFFDYSDETFGGHNNYRAHSIFSSLQFRF